MDASLKLYYIMLFVCVSIYLCVCMHVHVVYRQVPKEGQPGRNQSFLLLPYGPWGSNIGP